MDNFVLENPTKKFVVYGLAIIVLSLSAFFLKALSVLVSMAIIIRLLVILWMPGIANSLARNKLLWTIFAFLVPPLSIIMLGVIGYNKTPLYLETVADCNTQYQLKYSQLAELVANGELSQEQMYKELSNYYQELTAYAVDKIKGPSAQLDEEFLNLQLEKKGFVLNGEPEKIVEFNEMCPGCGAKITPDSKECPDCGLVLY